MRKIMTLARRELGAYFCSPMAYVLAALFVATVAALFLLGMKIPFLGLDHEPVFRTGAPSTVRPLFDLLAYALVIFVPLLTMRLVAEEFRSGTIETLMTAPVTDTQVVLGKFLGAFVMYLILLALTGVFLLLIIIYGRPDYGVVTAGYVGMILLGATYVSVGVFTSTLTRHQLVAGLVGIGVLGIFTVGTHTLATNVPTDSAPTVAKLNMIAYFGDFSKGFLDLRGIVFFLSVTAFFLFLSVKVLESRRWR